MYFIIFSFMKTLNIRAIMKMYLSEVFVFPRDSLNDWVATLFTIYRGIIYEKVWLSRKKVSLGQITYVEFLMCTIRVSASMPAEIWIGLKKVS